MEEPRGSNSAEEFRLIQVLAREGCYQEALERAEQALQGGGLGRKHAAKLFSLVCWLHTMGLRQPCPAAMLAAEEAVRLSYLINDEWVRSEALERLIYACCHIGEIARARAAWEQLSAELERNPAALDEGLCALWTARAAVDFGAGEDEAALAALDRALTYIEAGNLLSQAVLKAARAPALLGLGRIGEVRKLLAVAPLVATADLEWNLTAQALSALDQGEPEGREAARRVMHTVMSAGRADLAARFRSILKRLLA